MSLKDSLKSWELKVSSLNCPVSSYNFVMVLASLQKAIEALEWYKKLKPSQYDTCAESALTEIHKIMGFDE